MRLVTALVLFLVPLSLLTTVFYLLYLNGHFKGTTSCPPALPTATKPPLKFWHFIGVTAPFNHDAVRSISQTWGSRVDVTWYSDTKDEEIKPIVVEDPTYMGAVARNEGYQYMTHKLIWIWNHTYHNYDAEWFIRVYDDNYVFLRNLNRSLEHFRSDAPMAVGRLMYASGSAAFFLDGGYGWAISRAAMQKWGPLIGECINTVTPIMHRLIPRAEKCKADPPHLNFTQRWCAEDVYLSYCMQLANVTIHSWPWPYRDWLLEYITPGVPEFGRRPREVVMPNLSQLPVIMHTNKIHFLEWEKRNPDHF